MKRFFKTMAFTLLGLVLSSNLMADEATYTKVTSVTDGVYLIVNEASSRVFNGLDAANDYVECTISNGTITSDDLSACEVTIAAMTGGYSILINNGDKAGSYIYGKSGSNSIQYGATAVASTISFTDGAAKIENNSTYFCYNSQKNNDRFRFYKNTTTGANYIVPALYKKEVAPTPAGTVAAPTFTPATGAEFYPTLSVTLNQKDGKTIYYTKNTEYTSNEDVLAEGTEYTSAIALDATTTIQAVAIDGDNISDIANATYTQATPLSMEILLTKTIENGTTEKEWWVNVDGWVITGVSGNEVYASIQGSLMGILIYSSNHGFNVGDHLSGAVKVKSKTYYNKPEITNLTSNTDGLTIEEGENLTPIKLTTFEDIDQTSQGALISVENIQYLSEYNDFEFNDEDYINLGDKFYDAGELTDGRYYNVTGIVYFRYDNGYYFYIGPRNGDDITLKQATEYNITINPSSNGSVSVQDDKTQAAEGESVTLLIEPANNYKLATLIVDGSDVTASVVDNKYTFSMPGHAVNVSATFAAKDVYTITWKVKGQADATTEVVEGETLSLPTAPVYEGYKFVGWTASAIDGKQSTSPTLLANNTTPTANATYYAVFAVVTGQDPLEGNYTLNYDPDVKDKTLGYGNAVNVTAEDGSEWVVKAYKNNGMQINTGQSASIKIPICPANISTIEIAGSAAKAVGLSASDYSGSGTITYIAVGTDAKSQTIDLTEETVTEGYIVAKSGSTSITKVVVNYSGTKDHLDNYTTNPTEQVKILFDLGDGSGTFNDVSIDKGSTYTVTFDKPTPATGYEFVDWINGDDHYVGGNTIENVTSNITLTAQYKKAWYTVADASTSTEGSVTITTLTEGKVEFEATVTLTPQAKTGFAFSAIEAYKTGEDATKIELTPGAENTYTFSMPAYAVTVKATFIEAASACDINFYVAGALAETASATRGQEYSITQTGATFDGFTFVGWATQEYATEQEEAIITITSVTPPTGSEDPINLYAVYKRADASTANLVVSNPDSWVGKYLVVFSDNKPHSAIKEGSSSKDDFIAAEGAPELVISEGKINMTDDLAGYAISVANGTATGTYTLQLPNNNYLYIPNANGMCSKADATDLYLNYYSSEKQEGVQVSNDGNFNTESRILYENSTYWRCYTDKINSASYGLPAFYKITEGQSYYTTSPVVKYTISYDLNGGEKGEGNFEAQQVVKGETATLTTSIPVAPTGYEFDGWYNGDVKVGATIENVQNNIELVAHYNILSYLVTIPTVDNGTIEVATLTEGKAAYNTELTITLTPATDFEVVPNSLKVYETDNEENVVTVTENKFNMPAFPVTVVAAFQGVTPNFTITVQSANTDQGTVSIFGETETSLSLKEGDERTILAYPEEGYYFVNWTTSDDITIADADDDETTFTVKTSGATITANFEAIPSVTYTKIMTTDDLAYNDKVIIVAATADKAMSATQNANNRSEVAITRGDAGATITLATDQVAVLDVLSGNAAQTFAFHDANGYLYAASSSSNHMKSKKELDANGNGNWNVTISEGSATIVAQGTNTRKLMQYNPNNGNGLFTCYEENKSSYQYVSLYRIVSDDQVLVTLMNGEEVFARYRATKSSSITLNGFAPTIEGKVVLGWTDGETVYAVNGEVAVAEADITLNIKVCDFVLEDKAANAYATICLPRKIDHVENATLFHISHGNINKVEFEEVTDFSEEPAGMPYLVQVTETGSVQFFCDENVTTTEPVSREDANGFVGSLQEAKQEVPNNGKSLLVSGGQLHLALDGCYLTQYHAYIDVNKVPASPNKAPNMAARRVTLYNAEAQTPTNLNGLNGNMKAQKVMKDGQFYIIREAKMYNAQGIEVQ